MVPFWLISDQSTGLENMPEKLFCEIPCEIEGGKVVHFFGDVGDLHVHFLPGIFPNFFTSWITSSASEVV